MAAQDYDAYNNGLEANIFLKKANGSIYNGKVWPGATAFPDWFHPNTQTYWDNEFAEFFNADTGVDIDALWIDMNEPSNLCDYPCDTSEAGETTYEDEIIQVELRNREAQNAASYATVPQNVAPQTKARRIAPRDKIHGPAPRQAEGEKKGLPGRDLLNPPYKIRNKVGVLSNRTADTDLIHQGGWTEYDTHNL